MNPTLPVSPQTDPALIAALDIGSNSVRMSLVRLEAGGGWAVLSQHKETVRLGLSGFEAADADAPRVIGDAAIDRGVLVLKSFVEIARGRGASEIVAIATAALREAENRDAFVERARDEAGVTVRVVPGVEEARLIYHGVVSGLELGSQRALFIDIGGGSTELIIGTQAEHLFLDSLKLGALRVYNAFLRGLTGPVPGDLYEAMRRHVRLEATHALRRVSAAGFDVAVASSGTAMNLAAVAVRRAGQDPATLRNHVLRAADLRDIAAELRAMTVEERRRVPGLNPERADIIVSGATVLETLAEDLNIDGFRISDRSLREGVIVDTLRRRGVTGGPAASAAEAGVRRRSIERLAALVEGERAHGEHVARLTLSLFDQARALGLLDAGPAERELLEYAALLHDVGIFVAYSGHHRHSYYLIRHSELAGFTDEEIAVMANLAYFHRKSPPKKRHAHFQALGRETQGRVRKMAALLRLAEGLDRSHLGLVADARLTLEGDGAVLTLNAPNGDPHLEVWYVNAETDAFTDAYALPLTVRAVAAT